MRCLPSPVIKPIAIALDDTTNFRHVRRLVVKQMHNVAIGMMDGDATQPLYAATEIKPTTAIIKEEEEETDKLVAATEAWEKAEREYWIAAMSKGKVKGQEWKIQRQKQRASWIRRVLQLWRMGTSSSRVSKSRQIPRRRTYCRSVQRQQSQMKIWQRKRKRQQGQGQQQLFQ